MSVLNRRLELIAIVLFSSGVGFLIGQSAPPKPPKENVTLNFCSGIVKYEYVGSDGNPVGVATYQDRNGKTISLSDAKAIEQLQGCKF